MCPISRREYLRPSRYQTKGIPVIVFDELIGALIIALVIFFMGKVVNRIRRRKDEAPPAPTNEEKVLIEICDILNTSSGRVGKV